MRVRKIILVKCVNLYFQVSKKKRKIIYQSKSNSEFDKAELLLYEEVTRMPPFKRKTLVLIGCHGVGKRTLKNRLINSDPEKFGGVIPCAYTKYCYLESVVYICNLAHSYGKFRGAR